MGRPAGRPAISRPPDRQAQALTRPENLISTRRTRGRRFRYRGRTYTAKAQRWETIITTTEGETIRGPGAEIEWLNE